MAGAADAAGTMANLHRLMVLSEPCAVSYQKDDRPASKVIAALIQLVALKGESIHERLATHEFMPVTILNDVTVIECATFVTGPYATTLLADLGARVIKIESPPEGDPYRYFAPDPVFSFNFAHLNRNKESLVLDLKAPQGKEICLELLKKADVFVENFRPVRRSGWASAMKRCTSSIPG